MNRLLEIGADINQKNMWTTTALQRALQIASRSRETESDLIRYLIKKGANIHAKVSPGKSFLDVEEIKPILRKQIKEDYDSKEAFWARIKYSHEHPEYVQENPLYTKPKQKSWRERWGDMWRKDSKIVPELSYPDTFHKPKGEGGGESDTDTDTGRSTDPVKLTDSHNR